MRLIAPGGNTRALLILPMTITPSQVYHSTQWPKLRKRVWIRDKGTCQICGKMILDGVSHKHPLSYQCDHIQTIEKAPHLAFDMANLQATHRRCNRAKQTRQAGKRMQRSDGW